MIEKITSISEPIFFIVFIIFAIIIIMIFKKYAAKDHTANLDVPEPTKIETLDIAILKKDVKGAIITAVFNLWRQKAVDISKDKNSTIIEQKQADTSKFHKLEKLIYNYFTKPLNYNDLFKKTSIKRIEKIIQPNKNKLQDLDLLSNSKVINHKWKAVLFGSLLLVGFGGIKLYFNIVQDKSILLLIALIIISIILLIKQIQPQKVRTTTLGNKLIDKNQERFNWLKSTNDNEDLLMNDNLLYGISVFGIGAFIGSTLGDLLEDTFLLEDISTTSNSGDWIDSSDDGGGGGGGCSGGCGGD